MNFMFSIVKYVTCYIIFYIYLRERLPVTSIYYQSFASSSSPISFFLSFFLSFYIYIYIYICRYEIKYSMKKLSSKKFAPTSPDLTQELSSLNRYELILKGILVNLIVSKLSNIPVEELKCFASCSTSLICVVNIFFKTLPLDKRKIILVLSLSI